MGWFGANDSEKPERGQALGRAGEDLAAEHLRSLGYRILERNLKLRRGEIDILARHGDVLVIVEVKSASGEDISPTVHVNSQKARKLVSLVAELRQTRNLRDVAIRIDVVSVVMAGDKPRITVYPRAIDAKGRRA
ncbi:MAG: YraN family protein [Deltaproteobacteria bacterium]|nr:YraN family protein [Deltaproteobacteria bacterium]